MRQFAACSGLTISGKVYIVVNIPGNARLPGKEQFYGKESDRYEKSKGTI